MINTVNLLKSEALADEKELIRLHGELLECIDEQLKLLQTTVQSTVPLNHT